MRLVQIAKNVQKCTQHFKLHWNQDPKIPDYKSLGGIYRRELLNFYGSELLKEKKDVKRIEQRRRTGSTLRLTSTPKLRSLPEVH